ncbi:telomere binding protein [Malassezia yamatoensis]|uniref:Telomere binding protein n=1 Tax=Malassezia yamatoensis TaxID=253288 RepID=A0AAJ6CH48_9BASI|nr:telomere binding protein [Malassezia yamatoensis]
MDDSQQDLQSELLRLIDRPSSVTKYEELLDVLLPPISQFTSLPLSFAEKYTSQECPPHLGPWWAAVQHTLLSNILITWGEALRQGGVYEIVLDGYFTPENATANQIWRYTLSTCSEQLSAATRAKDTAELHRISRSALYQILEKFSQGDVVSRLLHAVKHERNEASRDVEWTEGIAQLIALPTRAANVFELDAPDGLQSDTFYSRIAQDWETALSLGEPERLASLLSKLVNPLMSLAISAWMPTDALPDLIELWSNASRCARTSAKEEQMLTTALLAFTTDAKADCIWKQLGRDTMFLQGVSTHLNHHDPLVRRLGMLVAECVSSLTVGDGGKPLQFPASVWDGQGEGRNICRVLRAMRDTFTFEAVRDAWSDRECWMNALNLQPSALDRFFSQVQITKPRTRQPSPKESPPTRRLPARIPARSPQQKTRPLIEVVEAKPDNNEQNDEFHTYADPYEQVISSDEGNESSDDEPDHSASRAGGPDHERETIDEAFSKPRQPPVYIHELAPLAREREIDSQKLLLKHAEPLLRRKTGWGYEISEHAADLCMALCTMQDHYGLRKFEDRRLAAMTALCVASPDPVVDCIYEQLFTAHYSTAQRISMLHAVANAAQELAGMQAEDVDKAAERLADDAVSEAHETGSRRTAKADPARHAAHTRQSVVRSAFPSELNKKLPFAPQGSVRPKVSYTRAALSVFVFPLINRLFAYRRALKRQRIAYAGSETILNDNVLHALLHTLGVLCYYAQNAPYFYTHLIPDVLEMADEILVHYNEAMVVGGALSLALIVLRATLHTSHGVALACSHSALLNRLQEAAQKCFAYLETRQGLDAPTPEYIESPDSRARRAAAAVVVQLAELQQATQSALLGSMPRP